MKIVDRETFLLLPANTLFAKYAPMGFGELEVKGETWHPDFLSKNIIWPKSSGADEFDEVLTRAEETGESFTLDFDLYGRDGLYDDDQLFAVFERADLVGLMGVIRDCLIEYKIGDEVFERNPLPKDEGKRFTVVSITGDFVVIEWQKQRKQVQWDDILLFKRYYPIALPDDIDISAIQSLLNHKP